MVKQGDRVWTRCTYDGPDRDGYPVFSGREGSRMLPDHPAQPAIAAWLQAIGPYGVDGLRVLLDHVEANPPRVDMAFGGWHDGVEALRSLVAALERP